MASVNKITQVWSVQFYNTSSVCCTLCSPPKVRSLSTTQIYIWPPLSFTIPLLFPLATIILLSVSVSFYFFVPLLPQFYISGMSETIWFLAFSDWLISLSMIFSRPIHVVKMEVFHLFLYSIYVRLLLYPNIYWRTVGLLHVLATMINPAMNVGMHIPLQTNAFKFLG